MNEKSKKVLAAQGAGVAQAFSWIGTALFGDHEEVLDDIAARGDAAPRVERGGRGEGAGAALPPRAVPRAFATPPRPRRPPAPRPEPEVITVEGVLIEDEDE
jgi:hypothetical protein